MSCSRTYRSKVFEGQAQIRLPLADPRSLFSRTGVCALGFVGNCARRSSHADLRLGPLECLLQKKQTFKLPYRGNASTVRHGLLWTTANLACPTLPLLWVCGFVLVPYLGPLRHTHTDTHTHTHTQTDTKLTRATLDSGGFSV